MKFAPRVITKVILLPPLVSIHSMKYAWLCSCITPPKKMYFEASVSLTIFWFQPVQKNIINWNCKGRKILEEYLVKIVLSTVRFSISFLGFYIALFIVVLYAYTWFSNVAPTKPPIISPPTTAPSLVGASKAGEFNMISAFPCP